MGASVVLALAALPAATLAQSTSPAASGFPMPLLPTIDLSAVGGEGEGELNIIGWVGYAEDGATLPEYDWVNGFEEATGCQVNFKVDDTSDQMVTDMRTGAYDGVSASGDAIAAAHLGGRCRRDRRHHHPRLQRHRAVPPGCAPLRRGRQALRRAPRLGRQHPDVQHRDRDTRADELGCGVRPGQGGRVQRLDHGLRRPIYIADAALYLKAHQPELGITDVYELTQRAVRRGGGRCSRRSIRSWASTGRSFSVEIDNFTNGASRHRHHLAVPGERAQGRRGARSRPSCPPRA